MVNKVYIPEGLSLFKNNFEKDTAFDDVNISLCLPMQIELYTGRSQVILMILILFPISFPLKNVIFRHEFVHEFVDEFFTNFVHEF